jgi:hypothetical protein
MASVVISGDTSGAVTITAPAVAGTPTLTLPTTTGTILTTASTAVVTQAMLSTNVVGNGPAFSVYAGSSLGLTTGTFTKVQLNTEQFDTNNNFDSTTNYRFTPTVAGYYQINAKAVLSGNTWTRGLLSIYKNGAEAYRSQDITFPANSAALVLATSHIFSFNGSSDYLELYVYAVGSSLSAVYSSAGETGTLSGCLVRSA